MVGQDEHGLLQAVQAVMDRLELLTEDGPQLLAEDLAELVGDVGGPVIRGVWEATPQNDGSRLSRSSRPATCTCDGRIATDGR